MVLLFGRQGALLTSALKSSWNSFLLSLLPLQWGHVEGHSQEDFFQCDGKSLKLEKGHLLSSSHPTSWGKEDDEPSRALKPILMDHGDGEGRHGRGSKKHIHEAWQESVRLTWKGRGAPVSADPGGR